MTKDRRAAQAFVKAIDLAHSGDYSDWDAIEKALSASHPEIRQVLLLSRNRLLVDDICKSHWNAPSLVR